MMCPKCGRSSSMHAFAGVSTPDAGVNLVEPVLMPPSRRPWRLAMWVVLGLVTLAVLAILFARFT